MQGDARRLLPETVTLGSIRILEQNISESVMQSDVVQSFPCMFLLLNRLTCFHVNQTKQYEFSHVRFGHSSRHVSLNKAAADEIKISQVVSLRAVRVC